MFGKNKILKPQNHDGLQLDVQEIFATFQGEGPFVGYPAVFVRLGGCNLACDFCDTEFDSFAQYDLQNILQKIEELAGDVAQFDVKIRTKKKQDELQEPILQSSFGKKRLHNLVVITGGEPLRQPIEKLCEELIKRGFLVQIETNGTLFRDLATEVKIICSPKIANKKYHAIRPDLLARLDAIKFIISANKKEYSDIADVGQKNIAIYLQPMDEYDEVKNLANRVLVLELAQKYGARISLQMHKILGID